MLNLLIVEVAQSAQSFYASPTHVASENLETVLSSLIEATSIMNETAKLTIEDLSLSEILSYCPIFLTANYSSFGLRTKLLRLLFNFAWHNLELRSNLAGEQFQICGAVFQCLRWSLREQVGPSQLLQLALKDALRLLQVLTYDKSVVLASWTNELISFLLSEIIRVEEPDWMPDCMAILCNLAGRSKSVCVRIRKSTSYKAFCRKLLKLLAHDSRIVVVSGLVLVGYLEDQLRDTVYCSENVPQTLQCVLNVLVVGDDFLARHLAADLLQQLLVTTSPTCSSTSVITTAGKELIRGGHLDKSMHQIAMLLTDIDKRSQLMSKLLALLLSLCSVSELRSKTTSALLLSRHDNQQSFNPIQTLCLMVTMTLQESPIVDIPLNAAKLLQFIFKDVLDHGDTLCRVLPSSTTLLTLIEGNVRTPVDTGSRLVDCQCRRITQGLRLAEVVAQDDDFRPELLTVVSAPLCAHIAESQLVSNPVITQVLLTSGPLPDWSIYGVEIVVELLRLLSSLKDHSKTHKDQYWKLLKDGRLVPMLAFAISSGNAESVHGALTLFVHCFQVHAFPNKWLADLIVGRRRRTSGHSKKNANGRNEPEPGVGLIDSDVIGDLDIVKSDSIDSVIDSLKHSMNLKDPKISQLLLVFDRKIANLESKERELEEMIKTKDQALTQSERLRSQYRSQTHDSDMSKFRAVLVDFESKSDKAEKDNVEIRKKCANMEQLLSDKHKEMAERERLLEEAKSQFAAKLYEMQRENATLTKFLESQKDENKEEREMHGVLRKHYNEMRQKFDTASNSLFEKDVETRRLNDLNALKQSDIEKLTETIKKLETVMTDKEEQYLSLELVEQKIRTENRRFEDENALLHRKISTLQQDADRLQLENQKYGKLKDQMKKMASEL